MHGSLQSTDAAPAASSEKQALMSRLLARLAHEIRNPLSSLDVHLQLLEEDLAQWSPPIKERASGRLEIIHGELHRLENIVRQFLRLSGPSQPNLAPVEVANVVRHVCELMKPEAAARRIELTTEFPGTLSPLMADNDQLIQALLNLVINALQAVGQCGRVELHGYTENETLVCEVRDSGPGVPAESLDAIFEPYYTTKPDGNGIGLWIARQIITAHKGTIQAGNVPGGGAVFTIRLPLTDSHAQS